MEQPLCFTQEEMTRCADTEFFQAKAHISRKIRHTLESLHHALQAELTGKNLLVPEGFNSEAAQFVKGEHLENFPYQYLDFPRHYSKADMFAFRSLFWWGHHVVFALILQGSGIRQYKHNLINHYADLAEHHLCLCLSPSLWEWKVGPGYTLELTRDRKSETAAVLAHRSFFKLARFIPLNDPMIQSGGLVQTGREVLRTLLPIITS